MAPAAAPTRRMRRPVRRRETWRQRDATPRHTSNEKIKSRTGKDANSCGASDMFDHYSLQLLANHDRDAEASLRALNASRQDGRLTPARTIYAK